MKAALIQPAYSMDGRDAYECFEKMEALAAGCSAENDIIVFPEYIDIPANGIGEEFNEIRENLNARAAKLAKDTAVRCHAIVCANYSEKSELGWRNTTHIFDREGNEVGHYYKAYPAPSEVSTQEGGHGFDCGYSYEYRRPYVFEIEGIRLCFLTCYDFYMYEYFHRIAREKPDIIIGCSLQRTDTPEALEIIGRFLCYNTNAYLLRASFSLGEDSHTGGCSMVVSPKGEMLLNMRNRVGIGEVEFDVSFKYYKSAGFGGKPAAHWEYADVGRRPWLTSPAGSMMVPSEADMPYPRICAHRGFSTIAPENSLPAYGAAIALGAQEIEFDLWSTKDGELVSVHDDTLDRVSDGHGFIRDYTLAELKQMDFGVKAGDKFRGLRIVTFEEILAKFACTAIMNIHVKIWDRDCDHMYEKIRDLLYEYGCEKHCYMMSSTDSSLAEFMKIAPEIAVCVGWDDNEDKMSMVRRAVKLGAKKIQLFKPYFNEETVREAHKNGILCNVFWSDDEEEAKEYLAMGIDCILTNDYLRIKNAIG